MDQLLSIKATFLSSASVVQNVEFLKSPEIYDELVFQKAYAAVISFTNSLQQCVIALLWVVFYLLLFGCKILIVVFPYILQLGQVIYEYHVLNFSRN